MSGWELVALVALVLSVIELVFLAGVVVLCARAWRKLAPTVGPMLAMFGAPPPATTTTGTGTTTRTTARCDYRGYDGDRCELEYGHEGPHEWPAANGATVMAP